MTLYLVRDTEIILVAWSILANIIMGPRIWAILARTTCAPGRRPKPRVANMRRYAK